MPHGAGHLRKEAIPERDAPGGTVSRSMSSETQVRVGQDCTTGRTCSSSLLTLHSVCARRLTGESANLHKTQGQLCASVSMLRGPWSGSHTTGHGSTRGKHPGLPELHESTPEQPDHLGMELPFSRECELS